MIEQFHKQFQEKMDSIATVLQSSLKVWANQKEHLESQLIESQSSEQKKKEELEELLKKQADFESKFASMKSLMRTRIDQLTKEKKEMALRLKHTQRNVNHMESKNDPNTEVLIIFHLFSIVYSLQGLGGGLDKISLNIFLYLL